MSTIGATASLEIKSVSLKQFLVSLGLELSEGGDGVKVVRHQSSVAEGPQALYRRGLEHFELYQEYQSSPIFDGCEYIISTLGIEGTKAKFIGVYRNSGRTQQGQPGYVGPPTGYFRSSEQRFRYQLVRDRRFDPFRDRLVVEWGKSALSWHQWLDQKDKEILELRPPGFVKEFSGYLDFTLTFSELESIVNQSSANSVWRDTLGAVGGVYLILDTGTGNQYVGSASGSMGLFGRWSDYVCTGTYGHGGNEGLRPIAEEGRHQDLQFTVLNILPLADRKAILEHETRWKLKLGTRVFGLNPN